MMRNNIFDERVEIFNLQNENSHLLDLLDENEEEEKEWQQYSSDEIQKLLHLTPEETLKLMKSGLIRSYRVGNEYRASKKSVEDNRKVIRTLLHYRNKKTMSVPEMSQILGLGKTSSYRLINQCKFKTVLIFGVMRIDIKSFEDWYSKQFHYKKVNGERPGKKYGDTIAPGTMVKVLGVPKSTAYDLMNDGKVDFIRVNGTRRVLRQSFEDWYNSQTQYKKVKEIEEVENYVD